jgi:hypothetical protein
MADGEEFSYANDQTGSSDSDMDFVKEIPDLTQ